jgi:hypothetical protein
MRVLVLALIFWCDPVYVSIRAIRKGTYGSFTIKVKAKISPYNRPRGGVDV